MGKIILVTGGSRGLGAFLVRRLAGDSAHTVCFTYVNSSDRAAELASGAENIIAFRCDQKSEEQVKDCHKVIHERYGRLDVLINNACSTFLPCDILASEWSSFQDLLDTNLKGSFLHLRHAAEMMKQQGEGRIINILSSYVLNMPPDKISFYITAKYALLGLTRSAAVELIKYGITVNAISPGLMETELSGYLPRKFLEVCGARNPMKRLTEPSDVADVAEFLVSERAKFLNGINITVNGGEAF